MKKFFTVLAVLLPFVMGAQNTVLPRVYDAQRTNEKIKIDGKFNEKAWAAAELSDNFADIRGFDYPAPTMQTNVKMLWDDNYLYIAATLQEENITGSITKRDDIIYHDNDFEVFIDPFCDGKLYYELENNALGTVMDLMMTEPYSKGGKFIMDWDYKGLKLAVHRDGSLNKSSDKDKAWYVEIAIPFASLNREFRNAKENKVWRINFSRVEWLVKNGPEENWVWSPTGKVDMHMPEMWGYLRFCDGDIVPPMPPAKLYVKAMWSLTPKLLVGQAEVCVSNFMGSIGGAEWRRGDLR